MTYIFKPNQDVVYQGFPFTIVSADYDTGLATVLNKDGMLISHVSISILQPVNPPVDQVALDAARWNAFVNCGRIRLFGWAGLNSDKTPLSANVHFGGEFWTHPHGDQLPEHRAELQSVLTAFADAQIALNKKAVIDNSKPVNYYDGFDEEEDEGAN